MIDWERLSYIDYPTGDVGDWLWWLQEDYRYNIVSEYEFIVYLDIIFDEMVSV